MRKVIPFDNDEVCAHDELLDICSKILENSTQTQHPYFVSQLYGRADCYGLAADMFVSALNTNVHVYDLSPVLDIGRKISDQLPFKKSFGFPMGKIVATECLPPVQVLEHSMHSILRAIGSNLDLGNLDPNKAVPWSH